VPTIKSQKPKEIPFANISANSSNSTVESTQLKIAFSEFKEVS
jgi:hypothetical protein